MKLIFLDADGTLFHHSGYIPDSAFKACQQAQANGHKICLCTGRQKAELFGDLLKIQYDGIIAGSGASILVNGKSIQEFSFTKEEFEKVHSFIETHHIHAMYECRDGLFGTRKTQQKLEELLKEQCGHLNKEDYQKHGLFHVYDMFHVTDDLQKLPINKISFLESNLKYQEVYEKLHHDFDLVPATFAPFGKESGEIASYHISKATGMEVLIQYYQAKIEDTIAIGDGFNDLCMFDKAALSIAMGNAHDKVKEKADRVTACLEDDGIYKAFKDLQLI